MDGATFDINIQAQALGVESSAQQLNAFAAQIQQVDAVATSFDTSVAAASRALADASAAAKSAADGLSAAQKSYDELERAANMAAKAVEKAAAAGKETKELASAAAAAKSAMEAQAKAVDALRVKSEAAAAAEKELKGTLDVLKGKQSEAANAWSKNSDAQDESNESSATTISAYIRIAKEVWKVVKAVYAAAKGFIEFLFAQNPQAVDRLTRAYDKMQRGFKSLFSGLKFDKLVAGLEDVMQMFDEGTSSANGLKTLVETIFQPMIDLAAKAAPYIKEMFKGMIHGALLCVIAVLEIRNAILKAMSPETRAWFKKAAAEVFTLKNAFYLGTGIVILLTIALTALVLVLASMVFIVSLPIIAIGILIYTFYKLYEAIKATDPTGWLKDKWQGFVDWLSGLWDKTIGAALNFGKNLATNIIAGLTGGLAQKSPEVENAMQGVLAAAKASAATALDSHSPSRVYAKLGATIPAGFAQGIENDNGGVQSAIESMASPSDDVGGGGSSSTSSTTNTSSTSSSNNARNVYIGSLVLGDSSDATIEKAKRAVLEIFEAEAVVIGGGEVAA